MGGDSEVKQILIDFQTIKTRENFISIHKFKQFSF